MIRTRFEQGAPYLLGVLVLLAAWELASRNINPLFFPDLATIWRSFLSLVGGDVWSHIGISLYRILAGFLIGSVVAIPIGVMIGSIRWVRLLLDSTLEFFRFIPPIAMIVLAVAWFGAGELATIFLIIFSTVFIVIVNTEEGVHHTVRARINAVRMLGASPHQTFALVVLPSALPHALTGMRLAMGNAFSTIVSAEMIASDRGLGFLLQDSRVVLNTGKIFVGIVILGVLGFLTDRVFRILIARFGGAYARVE